MHPNRMTASRPLLKFKLGHCLGGSRQSGNKAMRYRNPFLPYRQVAAPPPESKVNTFPRPKWSSGVLQSVFAFLFGYVCGAIPFSLILTRVAGTQDLRAIGSGNIGGTNVLRTGRKDLATLTLLLDLLKGTVAVLTVARFAPGSPMLAAAAGAFRGHLFPAWLRFRGGKGVATFLGCLLAAAWQAALAVAREPFDSPVENQINWTLPRLSEEIERATLHRISHSRRSVDLRKKGALLASVPATR
jgi:Glycerol-3-phosphate acyltransferase